MRDAIRATAYLALTLAAIAIAFVYPLALVWAIGAAFVSVLGIIGWAVGGTLYDRARRKG